MRVGALQDKDDDVCVLQLSRHRYKANKSTLANRCQDFQGIVRHAVGSSAANIQ